MIVGGNYICGDGTCISSDITCIEQDRTIFSLHPGRGVFPVFPRWCFILNSERGAPRLLPLCCRMAGEVRERWETEVVAPTAPDLDVLYRRASRLQRSGACLS